MSRKADVQEVIKLKQSVADLSKKIDDTKSKDVNVIEEQEGRTKKMEDHLQVHLAQKNNGILYIAMKMKALDLMMLLKEQRTVPRRSQRKLR